MADTLHDFDLRTSIKPLLAASSVLGPSIDELGTQLLAAYRSGMMSGRG